MPPNHDSSSRNTTNIKQRKNSPQTSQSAETTSTYVNHLNHFTLPNEQRFVEETFAIVHCVIYSLLSRKIDQIPSQEAKKVRELTRDVLAKHDVYNSLCLNVGFAPENLEANLYGVAEKIFEDGLINWGRLVALLGFSVKVAEHFRSQGFGNHDQIIVELTAHFIVNKTAPWIQANGGWENIITYFNKSRNEVHFSPQNTTWFKGILVTATATLGLGALLAVSACK